LSVIVCKYCGRILPNYWDYGLPTDDEREFERILEMVRAKKIRCPGCGGHKWIRRVASKVL